MEPRNNGGPRDRQNVHVSAIMGVRYVVLLFHFTLTGAKNIVRYTDYFVTYKGSLNRLTQKLND